MDRISIRDLKVPTTIGVASAERANPQNVLVSIDLDVDASEAAASDDVGRAVDYDGVVQRVVAVAGTGERRLLERLADDIASSVAAIEGVLGVSVEVAKERVPIEQEVGRVAVRVERGRK